MLILRYDVLAPVRQVGKRICHLYLEINIVATVLVWIILHKTNGLSKMVAQRNFVFAIGAEICFFLSDTLFVMINEGVVHIDLGFINDNTVRFACKELYFFSSALMCFLWFVYFELMRTDGIYKQRKFLQSTAMALPVFLVLLIINCFTGFLFHIDANGTYCRGPVFFLTYVFSYVYVFLACLRAIYFLQDKNYTGNRRTLIMFLMFPLAPGLAGLIQFVNYRLPVACVTMALTTLLFYLNWIDQLISLDLLTGLNNRKQLFNSYDHWAKNHNEADHLYAMMIDANKFKSINDNYGHIQGDNALKNIAEALRIACKTLPKRGSIARYGGDESAIIFESADPSVASRLKQEIKDALAMVNKRTEIPFELTVSIGIAAADGIMGLKELIDKADEAMYEEKGALRR